MTKAEIKDRILSLQAQVGVLLKAVGERPNFNIDEENWKKVKTAAKKTRKAIYQKSYGKKHGIFG